MSNKPIVINLKPDQYFDINRYLKQGDNFVIKGGRGVGKTYSCMDKAVKHWQETLAPLVYCRLKETELKAVIPILSEMNTPEEMLQKAGIEFDPAFKPAYVRGRPAKTVTIKYKDENKELQFILVALLCDIYQAGEYKGYAPEKGREPLYFILDEFTNGINMFTGDVEVKTLDLIETFFRTRRKILFLLTNNNNENNAFKDLFIDCVFIRIIKKRAGLSENKEFNNYIEGNDVQYDYKSLVLVDYYYITARDIVGLYRHTKLGILLMKQESFDDKKSKAKKDKSIFEVKCQFIDEWCENVFRLAKRNVIKLYE